MSASFSPAARWAARAAKPSGKGPFVITPLPPHPRGGGGGPASENNVLGSRDKKNIRNKYAGLNAQWAYPMAQKRLDWEGCPSPGNEGIRVLTGYQSSALCWGAQASCSRPEERPRPRHRRARVRHRSSASRGPRSSAWDTGRGLPMGGGPGAVVHMRRPYSCSLGDNQLSGVSLSPFFDVSHFSHNVVVTNQI